MAGNDTLSMTLELKDNLSKQIQEDTKNAERLAEVIQKLNIDVSKLTKEKIELNLSKNLKEAEKALYNFLEIKEKIDRSLSRNSSVRGEGLLGIDETRILKVSGAIDDIIHKIMNLGAEASLSGNATKNLLASLNASLVLKEGKSAVSEMEKGITAQVKERAKAEKDAAKDIQSAFEDADKAAKNNIKNQELVKDALSRIATARAKLSAASDTASAQDQMHARLLMSLLDTLSQKLNTLKNQFLGEKGMLDGVLGSGYKGLMRNVDASTSDINERNAERLRDLAIAYQEKQKAQAAAREEEERAFIKQQSSYQAQQKASQATRQHAEELVKLRMELLRTQAAELQSLMKKGNGVLSASQYEEVRNALRSVREEMRQLEGVMQRLGSYSARDLVGFARGNQNWSPFIANAEQLIQAQQGVRQLSIEEEKLKQSIEQASSAMSNQNRILGDLKMMTQNYLSLWGAKDFLNNIIEIGGQLEMQRLSIGAILGDTAHANDLFERIKALAVQSPFGVVELDQYTKQLSAYGFKYNELYDMTKRLADISAGAGTQVGRLALALGHVRSEAALSGYTLRQFAMNNVPMVGELSKMLTEVEGKIVSVADVRKRVRNKEISYEDVEAVIKRLTDEGGMFYNMQEVISQSVKARFKNLRDALDIMYGEMAESSVGDSLKTLATTLTDLTRHWKELAAVIQSGIVVLGAYKAIMLSNQLLLGREAAAIQAGTIAKLKADKANIQLASSYRYLTAEEMKFNGLTGQTLIMANALALSEKKITAEHLARQVALGRLTKQEALQAIALADLTVAERIHGQTIIGNVYTYGRYTAAINGITMSVQRLGMALKTIFWNPLTAVFAGIGIVTEIWQKNNEEVQRAEELNDSLFNRATEGIRNIKSVMDETGINFYVGGKAGDYGDLDSMKQGSFEITPAANLSNAELITTIEKWTQFIKEYAANPNNILNNAFINEQTGEVRELTDQYNRLGQAVKETAGAYVWMKQASEAVEFAEKFSNNDGLWGITNDALVTNINDYAQDLKDYNDAITTSVARNRQFWSTVLKAARGNIAFSSALKENKIDSENLSEQIKLLVENQDLFGGAVKRAEKEAKNMGKTLSEFERTMDSYIPGIGYDTTIMDYYTSTVESRKTMENDMDVWIQGFKEKLTELGWNIKSLTKEQEQAVALAIAETVAKANKGTDEIRKDVVNLMKEKFGITIDADTAKAVAKIAGLKKSLEDLTGQEWVIDIKGVTDFDDLVSKIRKSYKSAKEYLANAKPLAIKMGIDVSKGLKEIPDLYKKDLLTKWKMNNPGKDSTMYEMFLDEWNTMAKEMNNAIGFSNETGISLTDPNKGNKGNKTDETLKQWRERKKALDEYYKLYQEYSKYMSKEEAIKRINDTGLIKGQALPENIDDYLSVMKKFMDGIKGQIKGTERQSFWDSIVSDYNKKDFEKNTKDVIDAFVKQVEKELDKQGKQWNLFKKILDATGSKEQASKIAFGGGVNFDNYAQQLRNEINDALKNNDKAKGKTIDELIGMDDQALQNIDIFKNGMDGIYVRLKKLEDVEQQLKSEDVELFLDALKNAKSLDTELDQITVKYNNVRKAIKTQGGDPTLLANADENEAREKAAKRWDWFKKNNADWGRVFGNLEKMTTKTLLNMRMQLEGMAPSLSEDVESTKALYEAIEKIDKITSKRNPFATMSNATGVSSAIRNLRKTGLNDYGFRNTNGTYTIGAAQASKLGLTVNKNGEYTEGELDDALRQALGDFNDGLNGLSTKFKAVQEALTPVIGLFDALGMSGVSKAFSMGSNALGSAVQMGHGAAALFGPEAGPYGAAIGAGLSVISSVIAMHDEALQEEINASKQRQKEMENLTKNLERLLERTLGGVYNVKADVADIEKLKEYLWKRSILDKNGTGFGGSIVNRTFGYISDDAVNAINKALETETYYDTKFAELILQRDELSKQLNAEQDKKDSDGNAIEDYKNQIAELDDEIKYFAEDMAKTLYDIDVKSWAKELGDALFEAWQKGEDAAEAWKKKVNEIIADVSKNIIVTKMIETAFKPVEDYIVDMMTENSGMLDPLSFANGLIPLLDTAYNDVSGTLSTTLDAIEAVLQKNGMTMKDSSSSTASKVIQGGFTENETGLLLSYVNAIRADVSINRYTLEQIMMAVQGQAEMPSIASAQLAELRTIASNTRRNADFAADIYDILKKAQTGVQGLKVV